LNRDFPVIKVPLFRAANRWLELMGRRKIMLMHIVPATAFARRKTDLCLREFSERTTSYGVAMTITPVVITARIFSASSFELLLHLDAPTLQMEDRELSHTEENVHP
jgi:hypothetical protein